MRICTVENCGKKHYSLGYCKNHKENFLRCGNPLGKRHKCFAKDCHRSTTNKKYCKAHSARNKFGRNMDLSIRYTLKGRRNPRWNGGTSEYPGSYEMKKNRLKILEKTKGLCEICGNIGKQIHHRDGSRNNHSLDNLILLCLNCHYLMHKNSKCKTSKYIRFYGMTLDSMVDQFGGSPASYIFKHKNNTLKLFLDKKGNKVYSV